MHAILVQNVTLTKFLLQQGVKLNFSCAFFRLTPLHTAVDVKNVQIVAMLIAHGAVDTGDTEGKGAVARACRINASELLFVVGK